MLTARGDITMVITMVGETIIMDGVDGNASSGAITGVTGVATATGITVGTATTMVGTAIGIVTRTTLDTTSGGNEIANSNDAVIRC